MKKITPYILLLFLLAACTANIPQNFSESKEATEIFPDFSNITIPSNIAPLNFQILTEADKYVTRFSNGSYEYLQSGNTINIPLSKWEKLMANSNKIEVDIYSSHHGSWVKHPTFTWQIAEEIDPYISYRLIPPSVESYERLSINQRNLTNFEETVIYANSMVQHDDNGQCINCHHYKNWETDQMMFHARQYLGGTVIINNGDMKRINLKTDSTISAGVYPAWHPTHNYIAFSTNKTRQSVHTNNNNRIEVFDTESDLILYNIDKNSVSIVENDTAEFECFPAWTPDGKTLYYVSAHFDYGFGSDREEYIVKNHKSIHYNLYKKSFNPETAAWGKPELVYDAASEDKSITLPRVSPDGRYLLFTMGDYGVFHIWHKDANLYLMDLQNGSTRELSEINSSDVESYHSWSSNGKWIIFSTRRDDGGFTRLYLSHLGEDGKFTKAFPIPQQSPDYSTNFMFSYNIPEFMKEPVSVSPKEIASFFKNSETIQANFTKTVNE